VGCAGGGQLHHRREKGNLSHLSKNSKFKFSKGGREQAAESGGEKWVTCCTLLSPASPPDYLKHPIETMMVGSVGTQNALEAGAQKNAKFFLGIHQRMLR